MLRRAQTGKQRGVTLIELLVAIALLVVLLSLAVPSFREWIVNLRIKSAGDSVLRGLQRARAEGIARNANVSLTFAANNSWTVGCQTATAICPATILVSEPVSDNITVTRGLDSGGNAITTYVFDNTGRLAAPTIAGTYTDINIDTTALDASVSRDLRINVSAGGVVRLCDPNVAMADTTRLTKCLN